MMLRMCVLLSLSLAARAEDNAFLKPIRQGGEQIALIWIQGAQVPAHLYVPLLSTLQKTINQSLWVGMPSFVLDTPEPLRLKADIDDTLKLMTDAGMPTDVKVFYGAHSLGTVFLQTFCLDNPSRCAGQILAGGFLARSHYYPKLDYPVPTLTMGGSMDGLARVTRTIAESYYQQIQLAGAGTSFPVVVIPGMNHWQWASGTPSALVHARDLKSELSEDAAHQIAAGMMADWINQLMAVPGGGAAVAAAVAKTKIWAEPVIAAYNLEGSRHFNGPRQINGPGAKECVQGGCPDQSPWGMIGQAVIAGDLEGWNFESTNQFVDSSSTPITGEVFHLPTIKNDTSSHTVSCTTFSQCNWDLGDVEDTGFVYTSASEIGTKMASRQCLLILGVGKSEADTPFSVDDPDFCQIANKQAYQWALDHADETTKARFATYGQPYTFGADIQKAGGPLYINAGIEYKDNGDAGVEISSPAQKTEIDYWTKHFGPIPRPSSIPDPGCFHYCKLLSPARAMEWIYVDGLRRKLPIPKNYSLSK